MKIFNSKFLILLFYSESNRTLRIKQENKMIKEALMFLKYGTK